MNSGRRVQYLMFPSFGFGGIDRVLELCISGRHPGEPCSSMGIHISRQFDLRVTLMLRLLLDLCDGNYNNFWVFTGSLFLHYLSTSQKGTQPLNDDAVRLEYFFLGGGQLFPVEQTKRYDRTCEAPMDKINNG